MLSAARFILCTERTSLQADIQDKYRRAQPAANSATPTEAMIKPKFLNTFNILAF